MAADSLAQLRREYDVVICEGAGSPAEINLRATDIANMGLARAAGLPVIVVGDIDRGGVFAALHGTLALLEPADQALVAGFVINKFRGARELLEPGRPHAARPDRSPIVRGHSVDRPAVARRGGLARARRPGARRPRAARSAHDVLRVSVVRLPRISNFTDADALAAEPGVLVRFATTPAELADADLVVLPGTRATVADLAWLRDRGSPTRSRRARPRGGRCSGSAAATRCSAAKSTTR